MREWISPEQWRVLPNRCEERQFTGRLAGLGQKVPGEWLCCPSEAVETLPVGIYQKPLCAEHAPKWRRDA